MDSLLGSMPFAHELGVEPLDASAQEVRGRLAWSARLCTMGGVLHGGALMSLADTIGAVCAVLNLPSGAATSTIESKTNFFRAVREGHVDAVAQVTQTQAVLQPTSP